MVQTLFDPCHISHMPRSTYVSNPTWHHHHHCHLIGYKLHNKQYILVAVVFSVGPPYRKPLWTNGRLLLTLAVLVTLTVWCVIYPSNWALEWLELEVIPFGFRIFLVTLAAANLAISYICEKYFFLHLAGWLASIFKNLKGRAQSGYAPYPSPTRRYTNV